MGKVFEDRTVFCTGAFGFEFRIDKNIADRITASFSFGDRINIAMRRDYGYDMRIINMYPKATNVLVLVFLLGWLEVRFCYSRYIAASAVKSIMRELGGLNVKEIHDPEGFTEDDRQRQGQIRHLLGL